MKPEEIIPSDLPQPNFSEDYTPEQAFRICIEGCIAGLMADFYNEEDTAKITKAVRHFVRGFQLEDGPKPAL